MYKINNNYCKNKQCNEEHHYHNFFHATLCIVNRNMTSLDTCFFIIKNNNTKLYIYKINVKNKKPLRDIYERQLITKIIDK